MCRPNCRYAVPWRAGYMLLSPYVRSARYPPIKKLSDSGPYINNGPSSDPVAALTRMAPYTCVCVCIYLSISVRSLRDIITGYGVIYRQ